MRVPSIPRIVILAVTLLAAVAFALMLVDTAPMSGTVPTTTSIGWTP